MSDSKVQMFRQSKGPVKLEDFEKYQKEWTNTYDKLIKRYGTNFEHVEKVQKLLDLKEAKLIKKYNQPIWIELPTTTAEYIELCQKYGAPLMAAERVDGNGIVFVIMDELK